MDLVTLVAAGISVLAAVVSAWYARKNNVRELQEAVDVVTAWAEKALRTARTARMREVRAATSEDPGYSVPKELRSIPGTQETPIDLKMSLRRKLNQSR